MCLRGAEEVTGQSLSQRVCILYILGPWPYANTNRYVEMLEQQQAQLVAAIRELYHRLNKGQGWPGQPLDEAHNGHPLTHDILERLDLLHPTSDSDSNFEFEEDPNRMQQKLVAGGAPYAHRRGSLSSDSDRGHTSPSVSSFVSTPTAKSMSYDGKAFVRNLTPPTPPMHSPFPRQSQVAAPAKQATPVAFTNPGALDASTLPGSDWPLQTISPSMMDNHFSQLDFSSKEMSYDNGFNYESYSTSTMMFDPSMNSGVGHMASAWTDDLQDMEYTMNATIQR
jgi:hypothetical protein